MSQKCKRKALGRGLGALIPIDRVPPAARPDDKAQIFQCPVDKLIPNAEQPRQSFSEKKLRELTDSIRAKGVIHPLIVRVREGGYQIITGERRWRAAKLAGLKSVPVIVWDVTDTDMLELALIENLQREDLNPVEEADAAARSATTHETIHRLEGMVQPRLTFTPTMNKRRGGLGSWSRAPPCRARRSS